MYTLVAKKSIYALMTCMPLLLYYNLQITDMILNYHFEVVENQFDIEWEDITYVLQYLYLLLLYTVSPCIVHKSIQKKHCTMQNCTVQGTHYLASDLKISQIRTTLSPQHYARDMLFSKWSNSQIRTTLSPQHYASDLLGDFELKILISSKMRHFYPY